MFKAIPTLCQLMRLSAVCTVWRAAAASERAQWSKAVMVEHEARLRAEYVGGYDEPGLEISQVPFVDKLIRVSTLCGLEVVSTGGILATVAFDSATLAAARSAGCALGTSLFWPTFDQNTKNGCQRHCYLPKKQKQHILYFLMRSRDLGAIPPPK